LEHGKAGVEGFVPIVGASSAEQCDNVNILAVNALAPKDAVTKAEPHRPTRRLRNHDVGGNGSDAAAPGIVRDSSIAAIACHAQLASAVRGFTTDGCCEAPQNEQKHAFLDRHGSWAAQNFN